MRDGNRGPDTLRPVTIIPDFVMHPEGSVMIEVGKTKVICNASVENRVPPFMRGEGRGWVAAEYAMLPRATEKRNIRESSKGKVSGRTMEIQRLIGRSLRSVVDLDQMGERTIWLDCDVIQADGGTRTASITGAFLALVSACGRLLDENAIQKMPVLDYLAATSVGIMEDREVLLDLDYAEDSAVAVDMNVVMTGSDEYVEIQGSGEESTFTGPELQTMLRYAGDGIGQLIQKQQVMLGELGRRIGETGSPDKQGDTE